MPSSPGPGSPSFGEDLSRFPSESLHSFSFAHQTEDYLHNRQNMLKRSIDFMKDRMGWSVTSHAVIASAQARASGDVETQNMLDLLGRAQLVDAGNLPHADPMLTGPLSGPADMSTGNVFDKEFIPRTKSPDTLDEDLLVSPTATKATPFTETRKPDEASETHGKPNTMAPPPLVQNDLASENSSRTTSNESGTTAMTSPQASRRPTHLKRTLTDTVHASLQQKLIDTMSKPYHAGDRTYQESVSSVGSPTASQSFPNILRAANPMASSGMHSHGSRWVPAAQAIFTTEAKPPWTILAANDLACLVFGVTKAEVRKMGILEVVQEERRGWLEKKLLKGHTDDTGDGSESEIIQPKPTPLVQGSKLLGARAGGITAKLLSKPSSRTVTPIKAQSDRRPATVHSGDARPPKVSHHHNGQSRGVLLCGDVVPIQKRNGATGAASLWVKEKKVGLIWVLEEIHEDVANVTLDDDGIVTSNSGSLGPIWGDENLKEGIDVGDLVPRIPRQGIDPRYGPIDYAQIAKRRYYTCRNSGRVNIPATVQQVRGQPELRISSFPHIAGIVVVNTQTLTIKSSNSVFCGALFGHEKADGMSINKLIPNFDKILRILTEDDGVNLSEGIVVPEHNFRKASAFLGLREGRADASTSFLRPEGLPARHRDGSELKIDVQMRVVKSEKQAVIHEEAVAEDGSAAAENDDRFAVSTSEMVYALWITYSRHLHASKSNMGAASPLLSGTVTPLHQPSPGQTPAHTPLEMPADLGEAKKDSQSTVSMLTEQLREVALSAAARLPTLILPKPQVSEKTEEKPRPATPLTPVERSKKTIDDFVILEEMGQGAYGQVKLARHRSNGKKVVLKYVTKRRILVDTWIRDRRLGTVPLEIHVLDYLRRDGFRHDNIVEMEDFFEDNVNYYIEMVPHGLPGMDLFDYIELRTNMEELECRSIFVQVATAIQHLHTKAFVVHRDIKDENVVLDGDGNVKLIDFGSAAYIKNGPFNVFVGTIGESTPRQPNKRDRY